MRSGRDGGVVGAPLSCHVMSRHGMEWDQTVDRVVVMVEGSTGVNDCCCCRGERKSGVVGSRNGGSRVIAGLWVRKSVS